MALPDTYTLKPGSIPAYFDAILQAQAPERFSIKFLEGLEFKSTNDRLLVGVLKDLGFLDADAVPTKRYYEFLDRSQSRRVLATAIRETYADLFAVNKEAHKLSTDEVKNKLRTLYAGAKKDGVIARIASTFTALCEYADFTSASSAPPSKEKKDETHVAVPPRSADAGGGASSSEVGFSGFAPVSHQHRAAREPGPSCLRRNFQKPPGSSALNMDALYTFVYRGLLTDESLDKVGRRRRRHFGAEEAAKIRQSLSFEMLDPDFLADAERMAIVYTAIHAFENTVRELVKKAMAEAHGETWWAKVPDRVQKKAKTRMEDDAKFKWHGTRGASEIVYCDFGDLSSIIVTNWTQFESILSDMEWSKAVLNTLERSRNIVMHGGLLSKEDVERIGMNIRDWIRQAG